MELDTVPVLGGTGDSEIGVCEGAGMLGSILPDGSATEDLGLCLGTDVGTMGVTGSGVKATGASMICLCGGDWGLNTVPVSGGTGDAEVILCKGD